MVTIYLRWYRTTGWAVRFHMTHNEIHERAITPQEYHQLTQWGIPTL